MSALKAVVFTAVVSIALAGAAAAGGTSTFHGPQCVSSGTEALTAFAACREPASLAGLSQRIQYKDCFAICDPGQQNCIRGCRNLPEDRRGETRKADCFNGCSWGFVGCLKRCESSR